MHYRININKLAKKGEQDLILAQNEPLLCFHFTAQNVHKHSIQ